MNRWCNSLSDTTVDNADNNDDDDNDGDDDDDDDNGDDNYDDNDDCGNYMGVWEKGAIHARRGFFHHQYLQHLLGKQLCKEEGETSIEYFQCRNISVQQTTVPKASVYSFLEISCTSDKPSKWHCIRTVEQ